ncbi:KH domain-containing protein [Patescibacteria group bacterium]|nr:KH domain-containing protein [Patescibacteria group bacterium]
MMENQAQIVKSLIEVILEKLSVSGEIEILENMEGVQFVIKTKEAGLLIGEGGQNLFALNHLLKKIAENEFKKNDLERIQFFLDINGYQAKRIEELKNIARMNAQRVRYFKKEISLEPMNSYERRIIHSVLTEYPDIITESFGEDPNRHVIIKPFL